VLEELAVDDMEDARDPELERNDRISKLFMIVNDALHSLTLLEALGCASMCKEVWK
jgi:hypothetical protein